MLFLIEPPVLWNVPAGQSVTTVKVNNAVNCFRVSGQRCQKFKGLYLTFHLEYLEYIYKIEINVDTKNEIIYK